MKKIDILIVEDESIVAMEIENYVSSLDFSVTDICASSKDALASIAKTASEIVLMDICIKGEKDGIETAEIIMQSYPETKIIFLTAHLDDYNVDRAIAIDPVAYLSKPFNRKELRVALKIAQHKIENKDAINQTDQEQIVLDSEFMYDPKNHTLYYYNEITTLTKKENTLLKLLLDNENSIVDFYSIENAIWPDKATNTNTIRTLIKRLRQKLKHRFIETVSSRGYKMVIIPKHTSISSVKI